MNDVRQFSESSGVIALLLRILCGRATTYRSPPARTSSTPCRPSCSQRPTCAGVVSLAQVRGRTRKYGPSFQSMRSTSCSRSVR